MRAELERVLTADFQGRRVRFIGDCVHGLYADGTAHTTDKKMSVSEATRLAGALRSSFDLSIERLTEKGCSAGGLGLAIGFDLGPVSVTRLGTKGHRVRCAIGRKVLNSENRQCDCKGDETAIGQAAYDAGTDAVRKLFGKTLKVANLDYEEATEGLADNGDEAAKNARAAAYEGAPAILRASEREVRPYANVVR